MMMMNDASLRVVALAAVTTKQPVIADCKNKSTIAVPTTPYTSKLSKGVLGE
jgi:hypothetical protein